MTEMSRLFNFDDFEKQIDEALAVNEAVMAPTIRRPGEIGAVACQPSFDFDSLPELPEAS